MSIRFGDDPQQKTMVLKMNPTSVNQDDQIKGTPLQIYYVGFSLKDTGYSLMTCYR